MTSASALATAPVRFAPRQEENGAQPGLSKLARKRRASAEALASQFVSGAAGHLQGLTAMASTAPWRVQAVVDGAKASVDVAVERSRAIVAERLATAIARARSDAVLAQRQIRLEHKTTAATIASVTTSAHARVEAAYKTATDRLTALQDQQLGRVEKLYARGDQDFRGSGVTVGDEAIAVGRKRHDHYLSLRNGESSLLDGPLHDNRMEASADAAKQVAEEYKKGLIAEANSQADKAQEGKTKDLEHIREQTRQSRSVLDTQCGTAKESLAKMERSALRTARRSREELLRSVDARLQETLATLVSQNALQMDRLTQYGERQKATLDRDAGMAVDRLLAGAGHSAAMLCEGLQGFSATAHETEAPDETSLAATLADAQSEIGGTAHEMGITLEKSISGSERSVAESGALAMQSTSELGQGAAELVKGIQDEFSTRTANLQSGAATTFGRLRETYTVQARGNTTAATQGFKSITDGIEQLFAEMGKNLETGFKQGATALENGLRTQGLAKLDTDITKYADEAAAKVEPRWKKIAKVLLVIAVVIIVSVALGPVAIGMAGAAATALGASTAAAAVIGTVVGGAIVGAAASSAGQMTSNVLNGESVFKGVGKAALIGAIGGAFGGAGAALGEKIVSTALRVGLGVGFDVTGMVVGDLAAGNPISAENVLIGTAIGLLTFGALKGLGRLKVKIRLKVGEPTAAAPRLPETSPLPRPSTEPSIELPAAPSARPTSPTPPTVEPPSSRPSGTPAEPAPRSPQEAGQQAARETMEEAGADAARQAKRRPPAADEEAAGQRPRDAEAEPPARRRTDQAAEESAELAAKKAAELPAAVAAARTIAELNDAAGTPVLAVVGLLNALKLKYRWIRSFTARAKESVGHFSLWMIASETEVKSDYTEKLLAEERARRRRIGTGEGVELAGGAVRGFRNAGEVIERLGNLRNQILELGINDAEVGIRGSSVTGQSSKGGGFRWQGGSGKPSDVDFFFTSQKLETQIAKQLPNAFVSGRLRPVILEKLQPKLAKVLEEFAEKTMAQIGRKSEAILLQRDLVDSLEEGTFVMFGR
jgi:hypothetical protein